MEKNPRLDDWGTFVEFKTLASLAIKRMPERNRFKLTPKNVPMISIWSIQAPRSHKFSSLMVKSRWQIPRLVVGPFANLSDDFMVLCDFLGRARALKAIYSWNISPKHALAINRHILLSHFGHLASLVWAKLILGRFRDAVLPEFHRFPAFLTIT